MASTKVVGKLSCFMGFVALGAAVLASYRIFVLESEFTRGATDEEVTRGPFRNVFAVALAILLGIASSWVVSIVCNTSSGIFAKLVAYGEDSKFGLENTDVARLFFTGFLSAVSVISYLITSCYGIQVQFPAVIVSFLLTFFMHNAVTGTRVSSRSTVAVSLLVLVAAFCSLCTGWIMHSSDFVTYMSLLLALAVSSSIALVSLSSLLATRNIAPASALGVVGVSGALSVFPLAGLLWALGVMATPSEDGRFRLINFFPHTYDLNQLFKDLTFNPWIVGHLAAIAVSTCVACVAFAALMRLRSPVSVFSVAIMALMFIQPFALAANQAFHEFTIILLGWMFVIFVPILLIVCVTLAVGLWLISSDLRSSSKGERSVALEESSVALIV